MTRHSFRFRIKAHVSLPFMTCDLRIHTCVVKCQRADLYVFLVRIICGLCEFVSGPTGIATQRAFLGHGSSLGFNARCRVYIR